MTNNDLTDTLDRLMAETARTGGRLEITVQPHELVEPRAHLQRIRVVLTDADGERRVSEQFYDVSYARLASALASAPMAALSLAAACSHLVTSLGLDRQEVEG